MRDWLTLAQRAPQGGRLPARNARRVALLRAIAVAPLMVLLVSAVKVGVGSALTRQAPFALLGLGVLGAGWLAGGGAALLTTVLLTLISGYLFFPPFGSFDLGSSTVGLQLSVFFFEGAAISGIVVVMDRARRFQKTTAQRMEALQILAASLAVARTVEDVTGILLKGTADFVGATASVLVLPGDDGKLRTAARHGTPSAGATDGTCFPVDDARPVARAFRTGETEWIEQPATYRARYPAFATQGDFSPAAVAVLPLYASGRIIGATCFEFTHPRQFSEPDRSTIRGCVTQAAQALDRALADARGALARQRLEALADVSGALSTVLTSQEVTGVIVDRGTVIMHADTCTLYVVGAAGESLDLIGHRGVAPKVLDQIRHLSAASQSPAFNSLSTGQPVWGESDDDYASLFPDLAAIQTEAPRARAFWSVPLIVEGHPVGLLGMGYYRARRFSAEERSFIETFTGQCAQAMVRAQRLDAEREARRMAERAEASLATTLRSIGDAVIATDTSGNVTFMNPVAEHLTGWPSGEARGRPLATVFKIVNEQTRREVESPVDKVLQSGLVVGLANHTVLLSRTAGRETPIDDSGAPIRDESGRVQGVVLVFRDVSEAKRQEARRAFLAEATATLASSLDYQATLVRMTQLMVPRFSDWAAVDVLDPESSVPRRLAVMHIDPEKIELAHELAARYPDPPDAATGVPHVLRTGQSELYPDIDQDMVAAAARDDEHRRMLLALRLRSAMIIPLVARGRTLGAISLVHAESGRRYTADDLAFMEDIVRRVAVVIDNAQLYASERKARVAADLANRTKDEFLATVSHELRTPLNAILGWARMMSKAPNDPRRQARAIEIIERNSVSMARLIDDLLDISRIISGKVHLDIDALDPFRVIHSAVDAIRPTLETKDLQIQMPSPGEAQADVYVVMGDNNRLQQVLCNLLSNAIKFTPKCGRIEIAVRRRESLVDITVSDTGKGIDPEFLPHVFEPFSQADGSITRAQGGLGLGLAISRHLVELHGGKILANSEGPGQGASFTVVLPVGARGQTSGVPAVMAAAGRSEWPTREGSSASPLTLRGLKALVVDDDHDARQLVKAVLEERGVLVTVSTSVAEALAAIDAEVPDVILSDIGMPGEDGYSLIRKVRALPPERGGNIPAAALTAYTRAEARRQVLDAGYSVHLGKPVEPDQLVTVVALLATGRDPSSE